MKGADLVVSSLIENGVTEIFGVPGDTSMGFHDALARSGKIRYILCRDERNAAYMADGYARVMHKTGVVDVPSGGGVLYVLPGLAESNDSSIPLVCISSDITMSSEETEALTDVRQLELTAPVTKWNCKIKNTKKIPQYVEKAFRIAKLGKPGTVHISIPENIHGEEITWAHGMDRLPPILESLKSGSGSAEMLAVKEAIIRSKAPVIIAGGGVHSSQSYGPLIEFAERMHILVATSINGKGSIDETNRLSIGVVGANGGSEEVNEIIRSADVVMILGSRMNNVTSMGGSIFCKGQTIIQVDISESILGTNVHAHIPVLSDIGMFLKGINDLLAEEKVKICERCEWEKKTDHLLRLKRERIEKEQIASTKLVNPAAFFKEILALSY